MYKHTHMYMYIFLYMCIIHVCTVYNNVVSSRMNFMHVHAFTCTYVVKTVYVIVVYNPPHKDFSA